MEVPPPGEDQDGEGAVMSLETVEVYVTPLSLSVDGARVTIIGVVPYESLDGERRYIVSCQVVWRGWRSPVFQLDVASNRELSIKLRAEIARMKIFVLSGYTHPFTRAR